MEKLNVFIDGSCRPSTKFGAYAVMLVTASGEKTVLKGTQEDTTNNVMELRALIEALKYIKDNELDKTNEIEIFCDSQYVVKGVNEWWKKWKANNYRTTTGIVKNLTLWKEIEVLCDEVDCILTWVKGHSTNETHNEVDKIVFELTEPK